MRRFIYVDTPDEVAQMAAALVKHDLSFICEKRSGVYGFDINPQPVGEADQNKLEDAMAVWAESYLTSVPAPDPIHLGQAIHQAMMDKQARKTLHADIFRELEARGITPIYCGTGGGW
jgi:hypothetical protein